MILGKVIDKVNSVDILIKKMEYVYKCRQNGNHNMEVHTEDIYEIIECLNDYIKFIKRKEIEF